MKSLQVIIGLAALLVLAGCTGWDKKGTRTDCRSDWVSHDASPSFNQGDTMASLQASDTCVIVR